MADRHEFGDVLFRFTYEYNRLMRKMSSESGLYNGQQRILTQLSEEPGCTLSMLSRRTGVGMPSLSVSVRNMKKAGFIRNDGKKNARSHGLYLTESGAEKAKKFHENFDSFLAGYLEHLGDEKSEVFTECMNNMIRYMIDNELGKALT